MLKDAGAYTDHWGNGVIAGVSNGTREYTTTTMDLYGGVTLDFDNTYITDESIEALKLATLLSRPSEDEILWKVIIDGENYTAVALSLGPSQEFNFSFEGDDLVAASYYNEIKDTDLDGNVEVWTISPNTLQIVPNSSLQINVSLYGLDISSSKIKLKLVPLNLLPINSREIISYNEVDNIPALWAPFSTTLINLFIPLNIPPGTYEIYVESYFNNKLQGIFKSEYLYYTSGNYLNTNYTVVVSTYNRSTNEIIDDGCHINNPENCSTIINYIKKECVDRKTNLKISLNFTEYDDVEIYVNDDLFGNLSFVFPINYSFVLPNLDGDKNNNIYLKVFDFYDDKYRLSSK